MYDYNTYATVEAPKIDYHYVSEKHENVNRLLVQWARWVKVRPTGWQTHPMFAQYRSKAWQWHVPELHTPINTLEAADMEKLVGGLPEKHRDAVRWHYVYTNSPAAMARQLAVSKQGLLDLVIDGRTMLVNRYKRG
jgi:DNA-directed RNA polymerase specialized sigma24 family protein